MGSELPGKGIWRRMGKEKRRVGTLNLDVAIRPAVGTWLQDRGLIAWIGRSKSECSKR
jgi:hypothetical protein